MSNLKIFTDNIDEASRSQLDLLLSQPAFSDAKVRIMPDVHVGVGCVIGFTGDLGDKVIPNIVGVDIGCGMFCANLGKIDIDFPKLDNYIRQNIPSGREIHTEARQSFDLSKLRCLNQLRHSGRVDKSIGTLGGGNHFIEIDSAEDGDKYLVIHTGSRNLGKQVAKIYQDLANQICNHGLEDYQRQRLEILGTYKQLGKEREINNALKRLRREYENNKNLIPYDLAYLEGTRRDDYLNDMRLCQEFAVLNRYAIARSIADFMHFDISNYFESVHNYISFEDNIVRKGAISARQDQPVIIPINMRDGCILGRGKGNEDWNNSAPHGAGRIMSRMAARTSLSLAAYQASMKDVFTTSVALDTIDEAPFAYKPIDEILKYIGPTVEVEKIIKPVYNFKAME